ncbi:DNA damage-regulated autophagy modulator protein 1 isoform X1 [Ochotona curzoniae]|uniref:DNA damage-regulated autophagy modulator protein 1 isoform X1 n=1 Tax=Ochotona curzoniae TaxID=130825 RepID=UPI001B353DA8|nr:DNA damage-regulated autophagy modulator protein 1 isoform X1 [Ochotona curzoniae]
MFCFLKGMALVPFLLVTWSSAAFIISYVVAVLSGHVNPFLPYISDTGTTPPESGIFGFMINFSAFLGAATMYTRYKIVEKQNQTSYFSTPVFNLVSLAVGLVGCIGMGIVANFQELAVPVVHDGGALLAFVCGVIYTVLQSIISYKSCPQWNSLWTCHVRMVISAVSCVAVIPMIACASLISITKLEWNPKEKVITSRLFTGRLASLPTRARCPQEPAAGRARAAALPFPRQSPMLQQVPGKWNEKMGLFWCKSMKSMQRVFCDRLFPVVVEGPLPRLSSVCCLVILYCVCCYSLPDVGAEGYSHSLPECLLEYSGKD